jgi:hypothetical protein
MLTCATGVELVHLNGAAEAEGDVVGAGRGVDDGCVGVCEYGNQHSVTT